MIFSLHLTLFIGSWLAGETAGGCRNYLDTFAMNPQFRFTLVDVDEDDDEDLCTVIISLMQKGRRALRDEGLDTLTIGKTVLVKKRFIYSEVLF